MNGKRCSKCGVWKPAEAYHKSPKGLQSRCKVCRSRRTKPLKEGVKRYPKRTGRGQGANRVPIVDGKRTCTKCKETKPLDAFWKSSKQYGGRETVCKDCKNARRREIYAEKPKKPIVREILPERPCRVCGVVKPLKDFYPDSRSYDGHSKVCRVCYMDESRRMTQEKNRRLLEE